MRKTTILWLILAAICGTALFHTSQKVHDEREKLAVLDSSIGKEEESLRVLNAEWSYLNQPARLEKLAKAYLQLAPLKGSQFAKVENIPLRGAVVAEATAPKTTKYPHPNLLPEGEGTKSVHLPPLPLGEGRGEGTSVRSTKSATNTRNFTDVMKNLHSGVE